MSERHRLTTRPFVRDLDEPLPDGRTRTFWSPDVAGLGHPALETLGGRYGIAAARYMAEKRSPWLLGWAAFDMTHDREAADRAVQIAFFDVFAQITMGAVRADLLPAVERFVAERDARLRRLFETGR